MRPDKRTWLYVGLLHPPGVVVATRPTLVRTRLPPGSRLLLAGDDHAWGILPFIRRLSRDAGVTVSDDLDSGATVDSWGDGKRVLASVRKVRPHMVLVSLTPKKVTDHTPVAVAAIAAAARAHGATLVWLRPPAVPDATAFRGLLDAAKIPSFHSEALELPRGADGQPSVRGYAGWAGALWRWIG